MKTNFEKESHFENVSSFRNPFLNENMFLEKWSDPIKHIQGVSTSEMNIDGDLLICWFPYRTSEARTVCRNAGMKPNRIDIRLDFVCPILKPSQPVLPY